MGVKFKVATDPDGKTVDLTLRISAIANGWVIKAGGPPFFCFTEEEVRVAIADVLAEFTRDTAPKKGT